MSGQPLNLLIGLSDVSATEIPVARRWTGHSELPMILLAIWIIIEWHLVGLGFFSLLTASFSAYFVSRGEIEIEEQQAEEI
jgi:hypothetical protein